MFHFVPFCSSDSTSSFKFVSLLAKRPCLSDSFLPGNICKMGFPLKIVAPFPMLKPFKHQFMIWRIADLFSQILYIIPQGGTNQTNTQLYIGGWGCCFEQVQVSNDNENYGHSSKSLTPTQRWPIRGVVGSLHLSPLSSDLWPWWQNEHDSDGHRNTYIRPTDCRHA